MRSWHRTLIALTAAALAAAVAAPAGAANDPASVDQWGLKQIGAPLAWTKATGAGIRIGIVDSGVDLTHEDLAGKIVESTACIGTDGGAAGCKESAQDVFGHGTHVAGIAAAATGNGKGVAGVAPDAQLVVARVFGADGGATTEDVTAGIKWVVDHGARVVNLSLGETLFVTTSVFGSSLAEGVDYAWSHGAIPVLAAGNEGLFGLGLGSHEYGELNAVVVSATGPDGAVAPYSSPTGNAKWAIAAPGGAGGGGSDDIYSTYWEDGKTNQYAYLAGTSMAAPHVTGALAVILGQGLSQAEAIDRMLRTADPQAGCGANSSHCAGLLDLAEAVGAR